MKFLTSIIFLFTIWTSIAFADLRNLETVSPNFRIKPYLEEVVRFQKIGKDQTIKELEKYASQEKYADQVAVLCRMLFKPKEEKKFERPKLGGSDFYGGTDYSDWPLEPITIFKGLPICISKLYWGSWDYRTVEDYLEYCVRECEWNDFKYELIEDELILERVKEFIGIFPWREELNEWEVSVLLGQAKPTANKALGENSETLRSSESTS